MFGILIVRRTNHDNDIRMSIGLKYSDCIAFKIEKMGHFIDFLAEQPLQYLKMSSRYKENHAERKKIS
jgi:uncharacterized cupin superfamily protein